MTTWLLNAAFSVFILLEVVWPAGAKAEGIDDVSSFTAQQSVDPAVIFLVILSGGDDLSSDSDSDGVTDDLDQCPDTSAGANVDSSGCAASQLDSDNDGVTDDLDQCPATATGTTVDATGCEDKSIAVREVYESDVYPFIVSAQGGCTSGGCHGRANAPGGLRLYPSSESDNAQLNYDSLVSYIDRRAGNSLLAKIAGNSGHGGGVRYASGTDEYKVIEDWVRSVEALP